jgi:hypothetical protein
MTDTNDEPNLVQPSDNERARLPETSHAYIEALEARLDARDQRIAELEQENARLREDAAEHAALDAETDAGIEQIEHERDEAIRRADALERAVKSALDAWEADEFDEAKYYEIRATLYDQPATYSLEPLEHKPLSEEARKRGQDALRRLAGKDQPAQDAGMSLDPDDLDYGLSTNGAAPRQPDQPAAAGEADCCARTREDAGGGRE